MKIGCFAFVTRLSSTLILLTSIAFSAVASKAAAAEVMMFAAASTQPPLEKIASQYERATGDKVVFSFGSSSVLARQIVAGAPAELFLSADSASMAKVQEAGLIDASDVRAFLFNRLAVVVPAHSENVPANVDDLLRLDSIATGDPVSVPLGKYVQTWLTNVHQWDQLKDKIVPALDARAAVKQVETGAADAGIVYASDLKSSHGLKLAFLAPASESPSIVYPLAVLRAAGGGPADDFAKYLQGPEAFAIFRKFGFGVVIK